MWIFSHPLLHVYLALRNKMYASLRETIFSSSDNILGNNYLQGSKP